jgi:molybdate transport system substrate-binding protein
MTRQSVTTDLIGRIALLALCFGTVVSGSTAAGAADIRVYTSGAPSAVQKAIAVKFTAATGHHVLFTAAVLKDIRKQLSGGDKPDLLVLPSPTIEALDKDGALRSDSKVRLVRVGIGVAVKDGAPSPDISTVDAFRETLLKARSIAHPDPAGGGFAGVQIDRMFVKLGVADAVRPKVVLMYAFSGGVENIAKGGAEIGLFNISEILPVKGVTLVGPLPAELQSYITFSGALHADTRAPEAATAFLRALADAGAAETWKAGGFESLAAVH